MEGLAAFVPGKYIIVHDSAVVKSEVALVSPIVGHLRAGDAVQVLSVVHNLADRRARGRVEHPPGWISLVDLDSGYRWALRQQPESGSLHEDEGRKAELLAAIRQREAAIGELRERAEQLRARNLASYESLRAEAGRLEARLLAAPMVPVDERPLGYRGPAAGHVEREPAVTPREESGGPRLPPGGRVVAVRLLEPDPHRHGEMGCAEQPPAWQLPPGHMGPQYLVEPSYQVLQPSPWLVQGWRAQKEFLPNVYPISRTPVDVLYSGRVRPQTAGSRT